MILRKTPNSSIDQPANCDSAYTSYSHLTKSDLRLCANKGIISLFLKYFIDLVFDKLSNIYLFSLIENEMS